MRKLKFNVILAVLSVVSFIVGFGLLVGNDTFVCANNTNTFEMRPGAAIYLKEYSGVKFTANVVDETAENYGILIVPYDYFAKAGIEISSETDYVNEFDAAYKASKISYPAIVKEGLPVKQDASGAYVSHSVVEINEFNYDRRWFGIAFQKNGEVYTYAELNENIHSISYIASVSLNKLKYFSDELSDEEIELLESNENLLKSFVTTALENVNKPADASLLTVETTADSVALGDKIAINTTLAEGVYMDVYYESSNEQVITVSKDGVISAVGIGDAQVLVKTCLDEVSTSVDIEVTLNGSLNNTLANYDSKDESVVAEVLIDAEYCREDSDSVIKYTFTNDGIDRGYYDKSKSGNILLDVKGILYNTYAADITDWSTAYVGFWMKNPSVHDLEIGFRFQTAIGEGENKTWQGTVLKYEWYQAKVNVAANSSWKYFEMSLADIASNADNMSGGSKGQFYKENVTDFKFCLAVHAGGLAVDNSAMFYIDGITVFNKLSSDPTDEMLVRDVKNSEIRSQTINRDKTYILEGDTSAKFTYYHDGWNGEWYYLTANDAQSFGVASWENVIATFYVYSTDVLTFNFRYSEDRQEQVQYNVANEWTKITCSLRELGVTSIDDLSSTKLRFRVIAGTQNKEYSFYVDKLMLENVDENNIDNALVKYVEGDTNIYAEVITDTAYCRENGDAVIKYVFTNDGVDRGYYGKGKTGNLLIDDMGILYNIYKDEITDWSTAYVGFWIKNTSIHDLYIAPRFQTAIGEGGSKQWQGTVLKYEWYQARLSISANSDWKYYEMSLADIAANADNMSGGSKGQFHKENVTDFKLCIAINAEGSSVGDTATFYIDGLSIYNKA